MTRTWLLLIASLPAWPALADEPAFNRKEDVIYGRKFGTALTLDAFTPTGPRNGAAVVFMVSGGYFSSHEAINPNFIKPLLDRGYTVFAVVHGSQPRFTVDEIVGDVNRAVRYVRHHAADFGIDPNRIGATGASAGGHLSLMLGTAGTKGDPAADDPVNRESSRVQAVACFFPPTDFLNFGAAGRPVLHPENHAKPFRPAFDYHTLNTATNLRERVSDEETLRRLTTQISPAHQASPDDAPTLIIQGDSDKLVPPQQAETMVARLKEAGVETKLVIKPGAGHGWLTMGQDMNLIADWFDAHLKQATAASPDAPKSKAPAAAARP